MSPRRPEPRHAVRKSDQEHAKPAAEHSGSENNINGLSDAQAGKMVVVSISLSSKDLKEFEDAAHEAGYTSRSDAFRAAMHHFVAGSPLKTVQGPMSCVVSVIYPEGKKHRVLDVMHGYADVVHSSMHTHMGEQCIEQIVLEGESIDIRAMLAKLSSLKSIKISVSLF